MLAALNPGALVLGVASGGLVAAGVALILSGILAIVGVDDGPSIGLVTGIAFGLFAGGLVAGMRSRHSHRFHGMVTGLLLAFLVVAVARFGGSPADTGTVLLLAAIAIALSGLGGWLGGLRRAKPPAKG